MIQQHFLQQQRLNYNHDRLLERYHHLLTPKISQFRTFGTSSLPGRNYDQYLSTIYGDDRRRNSVIAQSRATIGLSSETYRLMGDRTSETLPNNVSSIMQHTRQQSAPLVHAERFEPVQIYDHPNFGPIPAYLRPVYNGDESENEEDSEVRSHISDDNSLKFDHKEETKASLTIVKNNDDNEEINKAPKGYISYKKWKTKYENLIPVNPLLYNIYTKRPNGSINSYGQSLYVSPHRPRQASGDEDIFNPTLSEIESTSSEIPHETSLSSHSKYYRLQPQLFPKPITPRPLEPIHTENESDSSDDESSPPDSPVPFLSRNKPNSFASTPLSITIPSTPIIPSSVPTIVPSLTSNVPMLNTSGTPLPSLASTNTSNIPPAPPMPTSLTTSSSTVPYQVPSNIPVPPPPAPSLTGSTTKAVTFAGLPSISATNNDDVSSSSDSEDDEKQKRRRRKKRQAAAGAGGDIDSSSSDD